MLHCIATGGQAADISHATDLLKACPAPHSVIADRAYDSNLFIDSIKSKGATTDIPPRRTRKVMRHFDKDAYKTRNVIERFIGRLKQFRRVATRYDKTASSFLAFVDLASFFS